MPHRQAAGGSSKTPTGIPGFDAITGGGLPSQRVTIVMGGPGCGKTIFGIQTLALGGTKPREPGVFVAFEESAERILANAATFEWAEPLKRRGLSFFDAHLSETIMHGGEFDLIGFLAMLAVEVRRNKATRIVFDGIDVLLVHLGDPALIRRELFRLREWLEQNELSAVITVKSDAAGERPAPGYEFLQYMADCVVTLHHRMTGGTAVRFLRVAKYRGSDHSADELPFSIGPRGLELSTGKTADLDYKVFTERVSSGVPRLDAMLGGGYYRGSSVLISGAPGSAKTSLAAAFAHAACRRKEATLYLSFDEGPQQIVRNVASIGIRLGGHLRAGHLRLHSLRARSGGPELHVARLRALVREHQPRNLIVDPLSALLYPCGEGVAEQAATQVLDLARSHGITLVSTTLLGNSLPLSESTPLGVSTMADTWMHVSYVSHGGERNRALTIIKSRGTSHSNQVRELVLTSKGVTLADVYTVGGEVLMGTARWEREHQELLALQAARRTAQLRQREAELHLAELRARKETLAREQALREDDLAQIVAEHGTDHRDRINQEGELRRRRRADPEPQRPVRS